MKNLSNYMDMLVAQGKIGPGDRNMITQQILEEVLLRLDLMPSFNQKSAYDMGARDMKNAIVNEIKSLL